MHLRRLLPLAVVLSLVACDDDPTRPDSRYLGYIRLGDFGPALAVTATGPSVHIVATTYGPNSCHLSAGQEVEVGAGVITMRVLDRVIRPETGFVCADEITPIEHEATVTVGESGIWEIVIEGSDWSLGEPVPGTVSAEVAVEIEAPVPQAPAR